MLVDVYSTPETDAGRPACRCPSLPFTARPWLQWRACVCVCVLQPDECAGAQQRVAAMNE